MKVPTSFKDFINKPMDRKEFLKHIGVASLLAVGGGFIAKSLNIFSEQKQPAQTATNYGYGSSPYGGKRQG